MREWIEKKSSELHYYNKQSAFFTDYYPNIKLATEKEIEKLIEALAQSGSFASTHSTISQLAQYTDFTNDQVEKIVEASLSNNQVYWILEDEDVNQFMHGIITGKEQSISAANLRRLQDLFDAKPSADLPTAYTTDDTPF